MIQRTETERKKILLEKFKSQGDLTISEANELKELISKDDKIDEGLQLLAIFALVAIAAYAAAKSSS